MLWGTEVGEIRGGCGEMREVEEANAPRGSRAEA